MRIDLHCHTTASDGTLTPSALADAAARAGLDVIAVTDHDTLDGTDEAAVRGRQVGLRVVAGIELSTRWDDRSVHLLGYFVDPASERLVEEIARTRVERERRMEAMVERLRELGYTITMEDVRAQASGAILARPHVARALVAKGEVPSVRAAFGPGLLADGGPADVPRRQLSPQQAIDLVRGAGGAAVLAHPGLSHHLGTHAPVTEDLVRALAAHGLAGLEVDHPDHSPDVRTTIREWCDRFRLVPTGGTDYHGEFATPIGTCLTSDESLERLEHVARG